MGIFSNKQHNDMKFTIENSPTCVRDLSVMRRKTNINDPIARSIRRFREILEAQREKARREAEIRNFECGMD